MRRHPSHACGPGQSDPSTRAARKQRHNTPKHHEMRREVVRRVSQLARKGTPGAHGASRPVPPGRKVFAEGGPMNAPLQLAILASAALNLTASAAIADSGKPSQQKPLTVIGGGPSP